ncbi:MAG: hypothetical protein M3Q69_11830 [Acidobacteriota bacterium]|nr:hypothetical protein [Acidobacteriota bacterium]
MPPHDARAFHDALQSRYAAAPERLAYHQYAGATHFLSETEWEDAMGRVVEWVLRFG